MEATINVKQKCAIEREKSIIQFLKTLHRWDWANGNKQIRETLARKIEIYSNEGKKGNSVKTLQQLARDSVRESLAASGYDIRPKVKTLELPLALKLQSVSFD